MQTREARQRREALHEWSTALTRRFGEIELIAPKDIKEATKSAAGTERNHGAEVAFKAMLNRRMLSFAPAAAVQMLTYKAAEAGALFHLTETTDHIAHAGNAVVAVAKIARKAKRKANVKARAQS